jgi:hypothetical protein
MTAALVDPRVGGRVAGSIERRNPSAVGRRRDSRCGATGSELRGRKRWRRGKRASARLAPALVAARGRRDGRGDCRWSAPAHTDRQVVEPGNRDGDRVGCAVACREAGCRLQRPPNCAPAPRSASLATARAQPRTGPSRKKSRAQRRRAPDGEAQRPRRNSAPLAAAASAAPAEPCSSRRRAGSRPIRSRRNESVGPEPPRAASAHATARPATACGDCRECRA